jgi:hypothetical protein
MPLIRNPRCRALARALKRLEPAECSCPLLLGCPCGQECVGDAAAHCKHCRGQCHCPPLFPQPACIHVRNADRGLDLDAFAGVLVALARRHDPWQPLPRPDPRLSRQDALAWFTDALWGRLLELANPANREPAEEPRPSKALLRQDRVTVYRDRVVRGQRLWANDLWRAGPMRLQDVSPAAKHLRNGAAALDEEFYR